MRVDLSHRRSYPMHPMHRVAGALLLLILSSALAGCYLPSAARRSAGIVADGWSSENHGAWVALTGPGSLLYATGDFAVHALVPIHYDGYFVVDDREPAGTWFHRYAGEMMPLASVAIVCHRERSTVIRALRRVGGPEWREARLERWHYPRCIEVLPGSYQLVVSYLIRENVKEDGDWRMRHIESMEPSTVRWDAVAGQIYALHPVLGDPAPAPGRVPRSRVSRHSSLGTTWFELMVSDWHVQIDPVSSPEAFDEPVLEYREAWAQYEGRR
jgi:hypothetical protein